MVQPDEYGTIEEMLPEYFEGTLTAKNKAIVEQWIAASEENEQAAWQFYSLYMAIDTASVMERVDTAQALKTVNRRLQRKAFYSKTVLWLQRTAAILFIPVVACAFYFYTESLGASKNTVQMMSFSTGPGVTSSVLLPDSTQVYLNSESTLRYPSAFNGDKREIELEGEAYFAVTKNTGQPFIVSMPHETKIRVLGTSFNVNAYADQEEITTTLIEGKLGFVFRDEQKHKQTILKPYEKLTYHTTGKRQLELQKTDGEVKTSWKEGKIIFNNTPFKEAVRMLEKRYAVVFDIKNPELYRHAFTGTFTNQRVERILEFFRLSSHVHWKYVNMEKFNDERSIIELY